ncbi:hypothetical protein ADL21_11130 [Streptomyces albus subsp. albus]|nr:hypothetical protein ADL21_11130 [Streptomyces albus subsp. albus]
MRLGNHTATVVRSLGQDAFGDPLPGDPTETPVSGTSLQPSASTESTGGRDTVVTEWVWFAPTGTDVRATDQVRFRGLLCDVDGDPLPWDDERGRPHHIEVRLRRVAG